MLPFMKKKSGRVKIFDFIKPNHNRFNFYCWFRLEIGVGRKYMKSRLDTLITTLLK